MPRSATLALLVIALASGRAAAADPTDHVVVYEHGRLTVKVTDEPLDRLLGQIAAATRAKLTGTGPTRTGSFDFSARPLPEALTTILGAESFLLRYGADGEIKAIELLARGEQVPPPPPSLRSPVPAATTGAPLAEEEGQAAILQRPVALPAPLAHSLGSESVPIGRLLHAVTQAKRADLRALARSTALAALDGDAEVEAAYLSTLAPVDDVTLARMLRASSVDDGAEAWMEALSQKAPSIELRAKAAAVLEALREPAPRPTGH